jgi:hypothetical protein
LGTWGLWPIQGYLHVGLADVMPAILDTRIRKMSAQEESRNNNNKIIIIRTTQKSRAPAHKKSTTQA